MYKYLLNSDTATTSTFWDSIVNWCTTTGLQILTKLLVALLIWWISFKVINSIFRKIEKKMANKDVDRTIKESVISLSRKAFKILVIIIIISYLGVEMSSIVALITSVGVTVGLALQGSLSNFAGGILILVLRPFRLGDFIELSGVSGTVEKIQLFYTTICTGDNKTIIIPNSAVSSDTITNYSFKKERRVDFTFGIAYENDYRKAKRIITKILESHELVLKDKDITVRVSNHGASSIDIVARAWAKSGDYWTVKFDVLEEVKYQFDKNNISIPYNQMDVHIKDDSKLPNPIDENDELVKEEIRIEKELAEAKKEQKIHEEEEKVKKVEENNKKFSSKIKKIIKVD